MIKNKIVHTTELITPDMILIKLITTDSHCEITYVYTYMNTSTMEKY